ncbi:adenosylhomocysteine nucleosidase [Edaphobacter aggregans]|uniref:Adenosylhomocysteine nucleosidase n=1 Tax=Edaphobacter aggregans TaxID=570835 RepID=A0A428MCG3_9BACT|nr:phosphorylase [Edaphobacter aggregans]RSL14581.1 adenosylhomocysteine nucleosidase [Edaphobacter aggregans]
MKECPAIIAALPREVKHLVRGWKREHLPGKIHAYTNDFAVVVCAGMGPARATLAVQAAMSLKPVTALLCVGVAGACDPSLAVGDVVKAGVVVDTQSGERFTDSPFRQVLVSTPAIASVREKQRLHASYGAAAVDMEAATVARIAQAHDLAFHAIKAISDDASFELHELARFATDDGQFREAAFAAHALLRPQLWSKLIQLAGNSKRAINALTKELESQLDWYRRSA